MNSLTPDEIDLLKECADICKHRPRHHAMIQAIINHFSPAPAPDPLVEMAREWCKEQCFEPEWVDGYAAFARHVLAEREKDKQPERKSVGVYPSCYLCGMMVSSGEVWLATKYGVAHENCLDKQPGVPVAEVERWLEQWYPGASSLFDYLSTKLKEHTCAGSGGSSAGGVAGTFGAGQSGSTGGASDAAHSVDSTRPTIAVGMSTPAESAAQPSSVPRDAASDRWLTAEEWAEAQSEFPILPKTFNANLCRATKARDAAWVERVHSLYIEWVHSDDAKCGQTFPNWFRDRVAEGKA